MVSITVRTKQQTKEAEKRRDFWFLAMAASATLGMFGVAGAISPLVMREHDYLRGPRRTHHKEISTFAYTDSLFGDVITKNYFRFHKKDMKKLQKCLLIPDEIRVAKQFKCSGAEALRVFLYRLARPGTWPASAHTLCGRHPSQLSRIFHYVLDHIHTNFAHLVSDVGRWCARERAHPPRARARECSCTSSDAQRRRSPTRRCRLPARRLPVRASSLRAQGELRA
jgi:hypothetical protein